MWMNFLWCWVNEQQITYLGRSGGETSVWYSFLTGTEVLSGSWFTWHISSSLTQPIFSDDIFFPMIEFASLVRILAVKKLMTAIITLEMGFKSPVRGEKMSLWILFLFLNVGKLEQIIWLKIILFSVFCGDLGTILRFHPLLYALHHQVIILVRLCQNYLCSSQLWCYKQRIKTSGGE